jgi:hypothetical protein
MGKAYIHDQYTKNMVLFFLLLLGDVFLVEPGKQNKNKKTTEVLFHRTHIIILHRINQPMSIPSSSNTWGQAERGPQHVGKALPCPNISIKLVIKQTTHPKP